MKPLKHSQLTFDGEIYERTTLLCRQLETDAYIPKDEGGVFDPPTSDWPGDWLGRTILAQVMIGRVLGELSDTVTEIIEALPNHLNELGYIGEILPDAISDEQQISGHSWLLRGLCEYYTETQNGTVPPIIEKIVKNLYLSASDNFKNYPLDLQRKNEGGVSGTINDVCGKWRLSTDTGCIFIALDGLTVVYKLFPSDELKNFIETLIEKFFTADVEALGMQTHATLTALRGICRYAEISDQRKLIYDAEKIFYIYRSKALTAGYQSFNRFGRPEWSEPCAVIDSFILAMNMYTYTNNSSYIDFAQRVFYNAIGRSQRHNGGFGSDSCAIDGIIRNVCYENSRCCTMRAGEGLAEFVRFSYFVDGNFIMIPYLTNSEADIEIDGEKIHIAVTTRYPYEGYADIDVSGVTSKDKLTLLIYQPRQGEFYSIPLTPDQKHYEIKFLIPLLIASPEDNGDGSVYMHGHLILGCNPSSEPNFGEISYRGMGVYYAGDAKLSPINDIWKMTAKKAEADEKRIVFGR